MEWQDSAKLTDAHLKCYATNWIRLIYHDKMTYIYITHFILHSKRKVLSSNIFLNCILMDLQSHLDANSINLFNYSQAYSFQWQFKHNKWNCQWKWIGKYFISSVIHMKLGYCCWFFLCVSQLVKMHTNISRAQDWFSGDSIARSTLSKVNILSLFSLFMAFEICYAYLKYDHIKYRPLPIILEMCIQGKRPQWFVQTFDALIRILLCTYYVCCCWCCPPSVLIARWSIKWSSQSLSIVSIHQTCHKTLNTKSLIKLNNKLSLSENMMLYIVASANRHDNQQSNFN